MHKARVFALLALVSACFAFGAIAASAQQVVESVDIQGNRRLRDEDLFYYIKTRAGDVYDPAALERYVREAATGSPPLGVGA